MGAVVMKKGQEDLAYTIITCRMQIMKFRQRTCGEGFWWRRRMRALVPVLRRLKSIGKADRLREGMGPAPVPLHGFRIRPQGYYADRVRVSSTTLCRPWGPIADTRSPFRY
jgi:hypothetical protein